MMPSRRLARFSLARTLVLLVGMTSVCARAFADPIENQATGTADGQPLELSDATVTLNRVARVARAVAAEMSPTEILMTGDPVELTCDILPTIDVGDAGVERVTIMLPAGFANASVTDVRLAGVVQNPGSPAGPDQYEASVTGQDLTITLGSLVTTSGMRIQATFLVDVPVTPGIATFGVSLGNRLLETPASAGNADGDAADANSLDVGVFLSAGMVVNLEKVAVVDRVSIGDVVTYAVRLRNTTDQPVTSIVVDDEIPPTFDYLEGSAQLDGAPIDDPTGAEILAFTIGTLPGLVDENGNGEADPGEVGYRELTYQLVVGSGAVPGHHENRALARDGCTICIASNPARALVEVVPDVLFDLGTIVGKVFADADGNGVQDAGEEGVPGAMVVLDDGTYALTDAHGRYHFPQVTPGQRMVKLNVSSLPGATAARQRDVAWVTPGLVQKLSFGVQFTREQETIGDSGQRGVAIVPHIRFLPAELRGNTNTLTLIVNDRAVELASCGVELDEYALDQAVELVGSSLSHPIHFALTARDVSAVRAWTLTIFESDGRPVRVLGGEGRPPDRVPWSGVMDDGRLIEAGAVYQYQFETEERGGARARSPKKLLGVNRTSIISLKLTGEAFQSGSDRLSARARAVLIEAAEALREHTDELVVIEGHTDDVGSARANLNLSRRRAEAAAAFLKDVAELSEDQLVIDWYGEERPVAPNDRPEGRALNRRVEVKGQAKEVTIANISDQYRTDPFVRINGAVIASTPDGRFSARLDEGGSGEVDIELGNAWGASVRRVLSIPSVEIAEPVSDVVVGVSTDGEAMGGPANGAWTARTNESGGLEIIGRVRGRTEPGNHVEVWGRSVPVNDDGSFAAPIALGPGSNVFGLIVRNREGATRIVNFEVRVETYDAEGREVIATRGVPRLTLDLPPAGVPLGNRRVPITGRTNPENTVEINGQPLSVDADGRINGAVEIPRDAEMLVATVTDPEGNTGRITREVEEAAGELFLLAFADARFGARHVTGSMEAAGQEEEREYFAEGRLAFYLKGHISGSTLITAALDTRERASHDLFEDFDDEELDRLATNLDPDRMYPVYGDGSTVVYDAESQGKLYVAIDGTEARALVGNYDVRFADTELGTYNRTLFGSRFHYASSARVTSGARVTEIFVFGSESRHAHVRDLLRGTGGSLYYLSHDEVVEGSEQVALVVRDVHTGLTLSREFLQRNSDYSIKHLEGRLLFRRPVASVSESEDLSDPDILAGNPVFVEVDYETRVDSERDVTGGARARRQITDGLAVGATYVDDAPETGAYELMAADAEIRLGSSRIVGEVATTEGASAAAYVSTDGGLTYLPTAVEDGTKGDAWKAALELDIGSLFDRPGDVWVRAYAKRLDAGFFTAGNLLEQGTTKLGLSTNLKLTGRDDVQARVDAEDRLGGAALAGADETLNLAAQWRHTRERWGAIAEYRGREADDSSGNRVAESHLGTARIWSKPTDGVEVELERQQTLSGDTNDQTSLGVTYRPTPRIGVDVRGTEGSIGRSLEAGAALSLGDRRLYVSERLADGASSVTSSVVGVESAFGTSGRIYSEYQWGTSDGTERATSLLGAERRWAIASGLTVGLAAEATRTELDGVISDRTALSTLAAFEQSRATVTSRNEVRVEDGPTNRVQFLTSSRADVRLVPDVSIVGTMRYSRTKDRDMDRIDARLNEHSVGIAYRPVRNDRINALARYTRITDLRPTGGATSMRSEREMDVISGETIVDVTPQFQWAAKAAARILQETVSDLPEARTHTYLGILRLNTRIWRALRVGAEYRLLDQREANDRLSGWLSELTYDLNRHVYVGGGYNFTDFSDDEFRMNDYSVHGWFLRLQGRY